MEKLKNKLAKEKGFTDFKSMIKAYVNLNNGINMINDITTELLNMRVDDIDVKKFCSCGKELDDLDQIFKECSDCELNEVKP